MLKGRLNPGDTKRVLVIVNGKKYSGEKISPEQVKSLEVLKDKTAEQLWGKDGKNGALIITTKE